MRLLLAVLATLLLGIGTEASAQAGTSGYVHGSPAVSPDIGEIKVPKATGADAKTVAEIVGKRAELKDKTVTVRAKVVKVTSGVMGKNWVHLRDGTGSAKDNTNDVLATTQDEPKVGDIVVAKGVVHTDVNLGSGYSYAVLIDNAVLTK
jgi:hypothetical protein